MHISQQSKTNLRIKKAILALYLLMTSPIEASNGQEPSFSTSAQQKIDIFRKETSLSELATLDFSPSKQGKKAICHLSNKKKKIVWVDKEVLDKIEEITVLEALQKGYHDPSVTCDLKSMEAKSYKLNKFDGVVAYPQEGQVVFYDVTSKK